MTAIAFGIGQNFYSYIERLNSILHVDFFSDNDPHKMGIHFMGDERVCISPNEICNLKDPYVIILADREQSIKAIERQLDTLGLRHDRVGRLLNDNLYSLNEISWPQKIQNNRIHKFIELLVHGTTECNFHCEYCYVWRKEDFHQGIIASEYSAEHIRKALSKDRLGGVCHINMCALGETLIARNIEDIIYELADEGHFLSIITNGTVSQKITKILSFPDYITEKIFFKFSFHYEELIRTGLISTFWKNVEKIRNSPCSYSIEITPSDHLLDKIDDVREEFVRNEDGAMPHITFTRDATKEGLDLYSELSLDEYVNFWKQFDSDLFDLKTRLYKRHISENCYAGAWSYRINLVNGNLQGCYKQDIKGSIFENADTPFPLLTVKRDCAMDYCFNNHAFISWGDVPEIECEKYLQLRDRECPGGRNWVKQPYRDVMSQKLYDNNFEFLDTWPDYEKLFDLNRKPALLMFNAPEYGNLGDQAIAVAEKKYFTERYPDREYIEIPCNAYIKENLWIKNYIRDDDIILLSGGGYLGSLWKWLEDISLNIITNFPNNKIVILPQTVYFSDDNMGDCEKELFRKIVSHHNNLFLIARDKKTEELLTEIGMSNIYLVPDMALTLDLSKYRKPKDEHKALICVRNDQESLNMFDSKDLIDVLNSREYVVQTVSTTIDETLNQTSRLKALESLWNNISDSELVITDRLHMMIFCVLLGVHCVAINNGTGKVFDFIETWNAHSLVERVDSISKLKDVLNNGHVSDLTIDIEDKYSVINGIIEGEGV